MDDVIYLLVAAGRGMRAGAGLPKQYRRLGGKMVITHTIEALLKPQPSAAILPVIHPDDLDLWRQATQMMPERGAIMLDPVEGGKTRQQSVLAGLEAVFNYNNSQKIILIHDCVRPFVSDTLIKSLIAPALQYGAAIPGLSISDAIKAIDDNQIARNDTDRTGLVTVQTPQAFKFDAILAAHRKAAEAGRDDFPDDAAVAAWARQKVKIIPGERENIKLTEPKDFDLAEKMVMAKLGDVRTGQGFDVHAFAKEGEACADALYLGGIALESEYRLTGHSDADVVLHALTDAVLGAIGDGDIGTHFPPSDPKWRGARSALFLEDAVRRVTARGGIIGHMDCTIIAETPKISPHREAMRTSIASITGTGIDRISVKATTTEKLGFTGRKEGIAAQAVVTIRLPL